jgi:hypothetical protein
MIGSMFKVNALEGARRTSLGTAGMALAPVLRGQPAIAGFSLSRRDKQKATSSKDLSAQPPGAIGGDPIDAGQI